MFYIDTLIGTISRQKNNPPIISLNPSSPQGPQLPPINPENQSVGGSQDVVPPQHMEPLLMPLPVSQKFLEDVSMNVEFIYNTPVVEKLREISEKKWYQLF